MDAKRIKEAERKFTNYLKEKLIKKSDFQDIIYDTYIRNATESLNVADTLFKNKTSSLWVVVSSYYAMFYIASAYVYKKGYKAGSEIVHQVITEALIVLGHKNLENHFLKEYEEEKEQALAASQNLLSDYEAEKVKRSQFQYETTETIKEGKAKTSLERAKKFVAVIRQLLS